MKLIPSRRTIDKAIRDMLVIGIPGVALWVIGHPADLEGFGLDAGETAKLVGYATTVLFLYRTWRQWRGSEPIV